MDGQVVSRFSQIGWHSHYRIIYTPGTMRLFLLPISTRRTLIYCERTKPPQGVKPSIQDRLTTNGNKVFRRIPYEEWGLKTIPHLNSKRKEAELSHKDEVEVLFPSLFLKESKVLETCRQLATERQALHRQRMIYSAIGAPLTLPFALLPIIPNIPGFYLLFRAWSHWKALRGGQHLEFLVKNNLIKSSPSTAMDEVYTAGLMYPSRTMSRVAPRPTREQGEAVVEILDAQTKGGEDDVMLLQKWNGKLIAEEFGLPAMEVEIERAVEQVEQQIKDKEQLIQEKKEIEKATRPPGMTEEEAEKIAEAKIKQAEKENKI